MSKDTGKDNDKTEKKVKLRAVRDVLASKENGEGMEIKKAGEHFTVPQSEADELTKPIQLHYEGHGEGSYKRAELRRAVPA